MTRGVKLHGAFSSGRRRGGDSAWVPLDADPGPEQLIVIGKTLVDNHSRVIL